MMHRHSGRALAEAIVHGNSYRESHLQARTSPDTPALTIAISRQAGAGGTSIATEIGTRLGWPVYDHALVERIAQEMHLRTKLLESVDERRTSWLVECAEAFSQVPQVSESAYVRHLIQTILSLSVHGSCVIVGRGAAHILPPVTTLRIGLVANREDRVTTLSRELSIPREEANYRLDVIDRERIAFVKDHFQRDPRDPQHFDLVLNSSCFSYAECAEIIVGALHRLEERLQAGTSALRG
jgi:cytidylate kinase